MQDYRLVHSFLRPWAAGSSSNIQDASLYPPRADEEHQARWRPVEAEQGYLLKQRGPFRRPWQNGKSCVQAGNIRMVRKQAGALCQSRLGQVKVCRDHIVNRFNRDIIISFNYKKAFRVGASFVQYTEYQCIFGVAPTRFESIIGFLVGRRKRRGYRSGGTWSITYPIFFILRWIARWTWIPDT